MGSQLPYRLPCEAVAGKPRYFLGGPFQHKRAPENEDKYTSSTTVPNWDTSEGAPTTIPPYERFTPDESGDGSCETHSCDPDGAPCSAWLEPIPTNVFTHIEGDLVDFALGRKRGWKAVQAARSWHGAFPWTAPEHGCNTNLCADGVNGFQAYQANSCQVKYLTAAYDVHVRNHFDAGEAAGGYLNADKTGARSVSSISGEITSTLSTSEENAANFGSGVVITKQVENGAGHDYDETGATIATYRREGTTLLDNIDNDLHCVYPRFRADAEFDLPGFISAWNGAGHATPMPLMTGPDSYSCGITSSDADGDWTVDATFSRNATVASWHFTVTQNNGSDENNTWEYYGSITLSDPNRGDDVLADIYSNLHSKWPLNDDHLYPWRTDLRGSLAPYVTRKEVVNTSPLGFNFYYVDDLTSPTDDVDGNHPFDPGWSPTYDLRTWFDDRIYIWLFPDGMDSTNSAATSLYKVFDGSILGAPKPAGYQNYFDFLFQDIRGCCQRPGDDSQTWSWYQIGWGMTPATFNALSSCQIPLNATQWNNWFMAANKPGGAWILYSDKGDYFPADCINPDDSHSGAGDTGKIVACKYAEILEPWPSQNFALPAGDMKFWFDETRVYCATNVSGSGEGSAWSLIDPKTGSAPSTIETDDLWGGPIVEGFYVVSAYAGGGVTLGAKQYDIPSNWASKSNGDDATCFGPLRRPTYPSLLGRAAITADMAGSTFTFAAAQPAFGMNSSTHQEQVDLYDSAMTLLQSNVTATRVDGTHFTVPPGSAAVSAAWCLIHGAPNYYINDASPKGDFTVLQWWFDYRNIAEGESGRTDCDGNPLTVPDTITYPNADCNANDLAVAFPGHGFSRFCQTPGCLPFVPCAPRVVCISPNGETWNNGITIAMPATMVWDEEYGTRYQAVVESTMTDLFWLPPHFPCNIKSCAIWKMDDGTCNGDVHTNCAEGIGCPDDVGCNDDSTAPKFYYPLAPLVEARLTVPHNYGPGQDESAPTLPDGIQIGWLSPVDHADTVAGAALPPKAPGPLSDSGIPGNCNFSWALHETLCNSHHSGCRFSYNYPGC